MSDRDPFHQLTGAFDRPVAPTPDFAARLRTRALAELVDGRHEHGIAAAVQAPPVGAAGVPTGSIHRAVTHNGMAHPVPMSDASDVIGPPLTRLDRRPPRLLRWLPALEIAAAVLLILTLFAQLVGPETLRNAVIPDAFQPAQTTPPEEPTMWGANPGRTWEFGGVPSASAPGEPAVFAPTAGVTNASAGVVSGDMVVRVVSENRGAVPTQHLEAVSLRTGQRLWIVPLTIETLPAIAGGRVFIAAAEFGQGAAETSVIALDQTSGAELWRTLIDEPRTTTWTAAPLVVGSTVYVANDVGTVHALDSESGAIQWRALSDVEQATAPNGGLLLERAGTTAADTRHLYVTTAAAEFVALNLRSGAVSWRIPLVPQYGTSFLSANVMTDGSMIVLDLVLRIPPDARFSGPELATAIVVGLDAQDGQQRWIRRGVPPSGVRVLAGGLVVAAIVDDRTSDGSAWITVMRATDGTAVWHLTDNPLELLMWSAVGDQLLVVTPQGGLVARELRTGRKLWEAALPPIAPTSPPLVTGNEIVVLGAQAEIAIYRFGERSPASTPVPAPSPSTATPLASPSTPSATGTRERSSFANGSWTFDAAVPAAAPGTPDVFPATAEGDMTLTFDVEGDTLIRLATRMPMGMGTLYVEAVDLTTGKQRWVVPVENPSIPIVAEGRAFILDFGPYQSDTDQPPSIFAMDLSTGDERWRVPFTGEMGEVPIMPLVAGSTLYVADDLGLIQALDVATGRMRWQTPGGVERARSPGGAPLVDVPSYPIADAHNIYILTGDGTFRAFDLETGLPVWEHEILGTYAAQIYAVIPSTDGTTVVLDVSTVTENTTATPALFSGPAVTVLALNARDGQPLWQRAGDIDSEEHAGSVLIAGGLLLAYGLDGASDGLRPLTALRAADGHEVWQSDVVPYQSTWWSAGREYALSIVTGGTLIAIDLATGKEAWRVGMPPMDLASQPLITEDAIVVVGTDGKILVWRI